MAVTDLKKLTSDLETKSLAPCYLIYGPEELRAREWIRRIETAHSPQEKHTRFSEDCTWPELRDEFQSLGLFSQRRLITSVNWVADLGAEEVVAWLRAEAKGAEATGTDSQPPATVWIIWEPHLDLRKKGVKDLIELLPTFFAEEVAEPERARWVQHLVKRKGLEKWIQDDAELLNILCGLPDWSLSQVERELEKWELLDGTEAALEARQFLKQPRADTIVAGVLDRKLDVVLPLLTVISQSPEEAFPLIGLLHWHARMLLSQHLTRDRAPGYFQDKARRWVPLWNLKQLTDLEAALVDLDVGLKSSHQASLGLWTEFALRVTRG